MLKAFRYDVATTPRYLRVTATPATETPVADGATPVADGATPAATKNARRAGISSTFSGLGPSRDGLATPDSQHMVLAVHEVSTEALAVDPATGEVGYSHDNAPVDPLGGETFDTPEFADSAEGHAQKNNAKNGDSQ